MKKLIKFTAKNQNNFDIGKIKKIHFVGIKGVGMASLAILAKERGISVTGSDVIEKFPTDSLLKKYNIVPLAGFKKDHISFDTDLVIYTGAHGGSTNTEVLYAKKHKIPVIAHGKAIGLFMKGKKGISVSGSHGKTTTSAMLASVLMDIGHDPSFAVGCGDIFL